MKKVVAYRLLHDAGLVVVLLCLLRHRTQRTASKQADARKVYLRLYLIYEQNTDATILLLHAVCGVRMLRMHATSKYHIHAACKAEF